MWSPTDKNKFFAIEPQENSWDFFIGGNADDEIV